MLNRQPVLSSGDIGRAVKADASNYPENSETGLSLFRAFIAPIHAVKRNTSAADDPASREDPDTRGRPPADARTRGVRWGFSLVRAPGAPLPLPWAWRRSHRQLMPEHCCRPAPPRY